MTVFEMYLYQFFKLLLHIFTPPNLPFIRGGADSRALSVAQLYGFDITFILDSLVE